MPLLRHVRYAGRQLRRSPLFALTAILSLAIGIGANTAIFSVANTLLLARTPGVRDMDRLVDIGRSTAGRGFDTLSFPTYTDLRDQAGVFDGVYAMRMVPSAVSLGGASGAERIYGDEVSASYFDVLGLSPLRGTFFHTRDEQLGVPLRQVVLSYAFWRRHYAGDPSIVGQPVTLNGDAFTVTGIAAADFAGALVFTPDVWLPLTSYARGLPDDHLLRGRENQWLIMGARLKAGVTRSQASAASDGVMRSLLQRYPEIYRERGFAVTAASRVPGFGSEYVVPIVSLLMAMVGLVLLVACTNLAGLLLARSAARTREVAVRLALGASRSDVFSMLMTESLLIFGAGAIASAAVAFGMIRALTSALPALPIPVTLNVSPDWRVLGFAIVLTLVTGLLTGAAPALQAARLNLVPDLKADASSRRRQRVRHAFIAAQMAACTLLIIVAGLFMRALSTATGVDPGFDVDRIDVATVDLELGGYPEAQLSKVAEDVRQHLARTPGVAMVAAAAMVPLQGGGLGLGELRLDIASPSTALQDADWNVVSPNYFDTLRLPIVRGRSFSSEDRDGGLRAAIVNERLARATWPGQDPIGQVLLSGDFRPGHQASIERMMVVGVARDAKYRWVGEEPRSALYVPVAQQPMRDMHFLMKRDARLADGANLQPAVRTALADFDRNLPLVDMASLRQSADLGLLPQRLAAWLAGCLGVVALVLGAIGIYGVTAFAVSTRTREIGVRMALGADRARILRSVLWRGLRLTTMGVGIGLLVALAVTRLMSSLLFGISPMDPLTLGATATIITIVALAASWMPARRAARTDPMRALRAD